MPKWLLLGRAAFGRAAFGRAAFGRAAFGRAAFGFLLLTLVSLTGPSALALQPCRSAPGAESLWPTYATKFFPRNGALLFREAGLNTPILQLVEQGTRRSVATTQERKAPGLILLKPKSLKPGKQYKVTIKSSRYPGSPPTLRERYTFQVTKRLAKQLPRIHKARVSFAPYLPGVDRVLHMRHPYGNRYPGRNATLHLSASKNTVVIALHGAFLAPKKPPQRWHAIFPYSTKILFATTAKLRCTSWRATRPYAPQSGRFKLTLTPWSSTGHPGKTTTLSGLIRTDPTRKGKRTTR